MFAKEKNLVKGGGTALSGRGTGAESMLALLF